MESATLSQIFIYHHSPAYMYQVSNSLLGPFAPILVTVVPPPVIWQETRFIILASQDLYAVKIEIIKSRANNFT